MALEDPAAPSAPPIFSIEQLLEDWWHDDDEQQAASSPLDEKPALRTVIGWCTYIGCSEGFACWESYVEHYTSRHAAVPGSRCPLCLQPAHQDPSERRHSWDCTKCAARFLGFLALKSHWTNFHGCSLRFRHCFPGRRLVAKVEDQ